MIYLVSVTHDTFSNTLEATWKEEVQDSEPIIVRCHTYSPSQRDIFSADVGETAEEHLLAAGWTVDFCDAYKAEEERVAAENAPPITEAYVEALEAHYDQVAKVKNYDNRFTCTLRAGYAGPFQQEGTDFALWMDNCNLYAYQEMGKVQAGTRPAPTPEELVAELPVAPW